MNVRPGTAYTSFFRNAAGAEAMNVDGSTTNVNFDITAPGIIKNGFVGWLEVWRINIHMTDAAMSPTEFGGLNGVLTNGLRFVMVDPNGIELLDLLDGEPIVTNTEFNHLAGEKASITAATGDDELSVSWHISESFGGPLRLGFGERLRWIVRDNLTGLSHFEAVAQGRYIP